MLTIKVTKYKGWTLEQGQAVYAYNGWDHAIFKTIKEAKWYIRKGLV